MATADIPVLQPGVKIQEPSIPDYQSTYQQLAKSDTLISDLGTSIAQTASNSIAKQLGYTAGLNPKGEPPPAFTGFDKQFNETYKAQAYATLGLQAQQLYDAAHVEMSKAIRITPELIASTNKQLLEGLNKITSHAPQDVASKLQQQYGSLLSTNNAQYTEKMLSQQREDQKNNLSNSIDINNKSILEIASSGDYTVAMEGVKNVNNMVDNAVAQNQFTAEQGRTFKDTARQNFLNGRANFEYSAHERAGQGAEYLNNYDKFPRGDMTHQEHYDTGQYLLKQASFVNNLKHQDQQLELAKFNLAMAENPDQISAQMLADLQSKVSPTQFINAQIDLVNARNKLNNAFNKSQEVASNITDKEKFSGFTHKEKNDGFDVAVGNYQRNAEQSGKPVSLDEAQYVVAASAAGTIPKYIELLKEKATGTNPQDITTAGLAIERMYQSGNGQKLAGLGAEPIGMFEKLQQLRTIMPDPEAAQKAHEIIFGKDENQRKANDEAWTNKVKEKKKSGETDEHFFINQAGISQGSIVRNVSAYARQIGSTYESFFKMLNGDDATAQKMLKKYIDQTYGDTYINGQREYTYLPIEKIINLPETSLGIIQRDVSEQLDEQFKHSKELYDNNKSDYYWEVKPVPDTKGLAQKIEDLKKQGYSTSSLRVQEELKSFGQKNTVEVIKHWRGQKPERYETILQANPYSTFTNNPANPLVGGWEVMLKSPSGIQSIGLLDQITGMVTYRPNQEKIKKQYAELILGIGK